MIDNLRTLFSRAHIIADIYYELGNKLIKQFRHEKKVVFYTSIAKPYGRKKKASKELPVDASSQLFGLSKE
jgi:23S rRNA G2445 N2-methylase RlmL